MATENESGPIVHTSAIITVTNALNYQQIESTATIQKVYEQRSHSIMMSSTITLIQITLDTVTTFHSEMQ